jgi:hypothetical protein
MHQNTEKGSKKRYRVHYPIEFIPLNNPDNSYLMQLSKNNLLFGLKDKELNILDNKGTLSLTRHILLNSSELVSAGDADKLSGFISEHKFTFFFDSIDNIKWVNWVYKTEDGVVNNRSSKWNFYSL